MTTRLRTGQSAVARKNRLLAAAASEGRADAAADLAASAALRRSPSYDGLHALTTSDSFHRALNPPQQAGQQSPRPSPRRPPQPRSSPRPGRGGDCGGYDTPARGRHRAALVRVRAASRRLFRTRLYGVFLVGSLVFVAVVRRLHSVASRGSVPATMSGGPDGRRRRVVHLDVGRDGTQQCRRRRFDGSSGCPGWSSRLLSMFSFHRSVLDPMLHEDGWTPRPFREMPTERYGWSSSGAEADGEEERCVPMASWQTTAYPNCNSVHEIDLVRSSSMGSLTFPSDGMTARHELSRRHVSHTPGEFTRRLADLTARFPDPKARRLDKDVARGVDKEASLEFLGQGWFRSAWEVHAEYIPDYDWEEDAWGYEETVVLKTLRIEREFLDEYYELHRRDALAMERLTFSPYVLDIYGYCGQSAVNELANFGIEGMGSLEKVARSFRVIGDVEPVNKIKLQLASMVAAGVSHMHSVDYPEFPPSREEEKDEEGEDEMDDGYSESEDYVPSMGLPVNLVNGRILSNSTLVHYDLNPRNIAIVAKGRPKLNDFNVAEFLKWDRVANRTCGFKGRFREPWWRSPEEMRLHLPEYAEGGGLESSAPLDEKVDVFSLGNILFTILTTHSPYKMAKDDAPRVRANVAAGVLPKLPSDFNETTSDPALRAIMAAMYKCLRTNPGDRPTAGEVAAELSEAVEGLPEMYGDKEIWRERLEDMQRQEAKKEKKKAKKAEKDKKGVKR